MSTRSRHDTIGPPPGRRSPRHRSRDGRRGADGAPPSPLPARAAALFVPPPGPATPLPLPVRGSRVVRRARPVEDGPPVMPRPAAIAAARRAVRRSRAAAHTRPASPDPQPPPDGRASPDQAPPDPLPGGGRIGSGPAPPSSAGQTAGPHAGLRAGPEPAGPEPAGPELTGRGRLAAALGERLPLWLRLRCGVEPRAVAALTLALLVAVGFAVHHFWAGRPQTVPAPRIAESAGPSSPGGTAPAGRQLVVDIAGKVRDPGIHELPPGARVADALAAAGGLKPGAKAEGLNQARLVVDGEQIVVGDAPSAAAATGSGGGSGGGAPPTGGRISLSSATAEQLETLPGVGPVLARHIIDYRTEHQGFGSIDELRDVDGIGESRFADLEPLVGP